MILGKSANFAKWGYSVEIQGGKMAYKRLNGGADAL